MKNKRTVLWIALIATAIIPVYTQQNNPESDFQIDWDKNVEGGIAIAKYVGTRKEVRIPPSIQGNPVTGIGEMAFIGINITSITIPNSVTSIGRYAFGKCTSLTRVTIPNGVTSIGLGAFRDCTSLPSITIPNSVTSIENIAFEGCTKLTSITIPNSVTSIGMGAFKDCTSLTSVTIPNSVTSIEMGAFSNCTKLTSVTIPNSVTSIWSSVFSQCTSLTSVTIGNSVTSIGAEAFWYCTSLASVTIPNSVTSIGYSAFSNCTKLTSVTFEGMINPNSLGEYHKLPFDGDLRDKYLASDGGPGTYTRFAGGNVWKKQSGTEINVPQQQTAKFPTGFAGIWKRDNFNNTLTFTEATVKSSSRDNTWSFISVSGDTFTLESNTAAKTRMTLTIRMVNDNIVISGDSGSGENNWNGTWRKQ